jgi:hypothetical protein
MAGRVLASTEGDLQWQRQVSNIHNNVSIVAFDGLVAVAMQNIKWAFVLTGLNISCIEMSPDMKLLKTAVKDVSLKKPTAPDRFLPDYFAFPCQFSFHRLFKIH